MVAGAGVDRPTDEDEVDNRWFDFEFRPDDGGSGIRVVYCCLCSPDNLND